MGRGMAKSRSSVHLDKLVPFAPPAQLDTRRSGRPTDPLQPSARSLAMRLVAAARHPDNRLVQIVLERKAEPARRDSGNGGRVAWTLSIVKREQAVRRGDERRRPKRLLQARDAIAPVHEHMVKGGIWPSCRHAVARVVVDGARRIVAAAAVWLDLAARRVHWHPRSARRLRTVTPNCRDCTPHVRQPDALVLNGV